MWTSEKNAEYSRSTCTRARVAIYIENQMHRRDICNQKRVHMQRENTKSQCFGLDTIPDCLCYVSAI